MKSTTIAMFLAIAISTMLITATTTMMAPMLAFASAGSRSSAVIEQEISQDAFCLSGTITTGSCNQAATNVNTGTALAANVGSDGGLSWLTGNYGGQRANAEIEQVNAQNAACISGTTTSASCNQVATNVNTGNAVAANVDFGSGSGSGYGYRQAASSEIEQSNSQDAVCISGGSTTGSCNQAATNVNTGNAVAANVGGSGGGSGSQRASSEIEQKNTQRAVCISGTTTDSSCNQAATNVNTGNALAANVGGSGGGNGYTGSQHARSEIEQKNSQDSTSVSGTSTSGSSNQAATNVNTGNSASSNN